MRKGTRPAPKAIRDARKNFDSALRIDEHAQEIQTRTAKANQLLASVNTRGVGTTKVNPDDPQTRQFMRERHTQQERATGHAQGTSRNVLAAKIQLGHTITKELAPRERVTFVLRDGTKVSGRLIAKYDPKHPDNIALTDKNGATKLVPVLDIYDFEQQQKKSGPWWKIW